MPPQGARRTAKFTREPGSHESSRFRARCHRQEQQTSSPSAGTAGCSLQQPSGNYLRVRHVCPTQGLSTCVAGVSLKPATHVHVERITERLTTTSCILIRGISALPNTRVYRAPGAPARHVEYISNTSRRAPATAPGAPDAEAAAVVLCSSQTRSKPLQRFPAAPVRQHDGSSRPLTARRPRAGRRFRRGARAGN